VRGAVAPATGLTVNSTVVPAIAQIRIQLGRRRRRRRLVFVRRYHYRHYRRYRRYRRL